MGDEVMFFTQGYELYLRAVCEKKVYEVAKSQFKPWGKLILNVSISQLRLIFSFNIIYFKKNK